MATYYVNQTTGANTNNGTAVGTPWKDVQWASEKVAAGDVINIVASATDPVRGVWNARTNGADGNPITFQGTSTASPAYLLNARDVTDGTDWGNLVRNPGLEDWVTTTDAYMWGETLGTNGLVKETTIIHGGAASCKLIKSGSPELYWDFTLPASTAMTVSFWYYQVTATKTVRFRLWDRTGGVYLAGDGSWGAAVIAPPDVAGSWQQYTISFNTNVNSGRYTMVFYPTLTGTTFYIDDVSLTFDTACTWAVNVGDTYQLSGKVPTAAIGHLLKCSSANWAASGVTSLVNVPKATSLANCQATAGTWWHAADVLYYHLAAGETTANVHLEATWSFYDIAYGLRNNGLFSTATYNTFSNLAIYGSKNACFQTGATGLILNECTARNGGLANFISASGATLNDCTASWSYTSDNFLVSGGAVTYNRCLSSHSADEGYEVYNGGTAIWNYCISWSDGENGSEGTEAFYIGDAALATTGTLRNCVAYDAPGAGIKIGTNGTGTVTNCIAYGNGYADVRASAGTTLTASYNCYGTSGESWDALGGNGTGTLTGTDPKWVDPANGDFHLQGTSPCINAGTDLGSTYDTDYDGLSQSDYGDMWDMGAFVFPEWGYGLRDRSMFSTDSTHFTNRRNRGRFI